MRLCLEIARAVRLHIGSAVLLVFNISSESPVDGACSSQESFILAKHLKEIGVDCIMCSPSESASQEIEDGNLGSLLMYNRELRQTLGIPTFIHCNRLDNASYLNTIIIKKMADYIYVTEALICNHQLVFQLAKSLDHEVYDPSKHNVTWQETSYSYLH